MHTKHALPQFSNFFGLFLDFLFKIDWVSPDIALNIHKNTLNVSTMLLERVWL